MNIKEPYKILFLVFVVLGVYYPALFAGVNSVDDWRMIVDLDNNHINVWSFFAPANGFYYRPLLMLSFVADKYLWGLEPSFMHLENILLHAANVVLVFGVAKEFFREREHISYELPLLAALLFAVHPINTESVNWISGRTDILGAFFVLLSTWLLLQERTARPNFWVVISSLCLLFGVMSKEVMLFYFPVGCCLVFMGPSLQLPARTERKLQARRLLFYSLPVLLAVGAYFVARFVLFEGNDRGALHLTQVPRHYSFDVVVSIVKVYGFYIKKLFVPVPLSFAITKISWPYIGLGIASLAGVVWFVKKRSLTSMLFLISCYLIVPAIIIAIARVAWTPIAERYLYLSSVFWSIACISLSVYFFKSSCRMRSIFLIFGICVLFSFVVISSKRNVVWQNNLTLYEDSLSKNKNFTALNNEYAISLIDSARFSQAEEILRAGIEKNKSNKLLYINLARVKFKQEKFVEARSVLLSSFPSKEEANVEVLKMLAKVDEKTLMDNRYADESEQRTSILDLLDTYSTIYIKNKDPFFMYRYGQLALFLGLKKEAASAFSHAASEAPVDAHYKNAASILAQKLAGE